MIKEKKKNSNLINSIVSICNLTVTVGTTIFDSGQKNITDATVGFRLYRLTRAHTHTVGTS